MKKYIQSILTALVLAPILSVAQSPSCYVTKNNMSGGSFGGFTTSIQSVNCNNGGSSYTITLRIANNGCSGGPCKELSHLSVEADAGTYSNISVSNVSGNMSYGSIANGPDLGQDPFQGFKVDNTSNFGDGKSGVFTITYTLTSLQDQQVLAKAGQYKFIASFSVANFQSVMNCNSTACITDSDGDGVADAQDDYPNDGSRAFNNFFPAGSNGTVAYEDLWPAKGDFDLNDLVLNYRFNTVTNASNNVVEIIGTFTIRSFGASYNNGFGFQLPNTNLNTADVTVTGFSLNRAYITLDGNGWETGQNKPTVIVYDNTYDHMPWPGGGIGVNTDPNGTYVQPATFTITMTFNSGSYTAAQVGIENFNPFLIVNQNRSKEVHLPNFAPTAKADQSLFGTVDDDSNSGSGRYYVTENNLPWAINTPTELEWTKEKVDIIKAYQHFEAWAESNGQQYPDWYTDQSGYIDQTQLYGQ
ncbi:MAG: hypothetical protein CMI36_02775 [Owenweeksia sp.]|nr:hypothetical protein [Owenweeksia sp.]MBF97891.1 hypothetical protein [Owenweeksia sp.]HBF21979.1 hypothetical protein [Cryomorphaceae bacterium]|tara:strand:- start:502 stop:1914 length:1413 start_codon:yes stop_codon:yes gene_type:complete